MKFHIFHLLKTITWFTIIPTAGLSEWVRRSVSISIPTCHNITAWQYLWLPGVGPLKVMIVGVIYFFMLSWFEYGPAPAVIASVAFVWMSGGIHFDGYADTTDGLFTHDPERKYDAMRDPNVGAMGFIRTLLILVVHIAVGYMAWAKVEGWNSLVVLAGFQVNSLACTLPALWYGRQMDQMQDRNVNLDLKDLPMVCVLWNCVYGVTLVIFWCVTGGIFHLAAAVTTGLFALYLVNRCYRNLGFVNGDVLGYIVVHAEILNYLFYLAV